MDMTFKCKKIEMVLVASISINVILLLLLGIMYFRLSIAPALQALQAVAEGTTSREDIEFQRYLQKELQDQPIDFIKSSGYTTTIMMKQESSDKDLLQVADIVRNLEHPYFDMFDIEIIQRAEAETGMDLELAVRKAYASEYYDFIRDKH